MNYRWMIPFIVFVAGLSLIIGLYPPATTAQTDERCFEETGQCISGNILAYWQNNGGLPVFGYPITPVRTETIDGWTGPTQWFERDRLEDHGAQGVLAGRLGAELLALQGRPWETFKRATVVSPGCFYFEQTEHIVCPPFSTYWEENGGLERFGYPITEAFQEEIEGKRLIVQYFERRRMEIHMDLAQVLLGLLGKEVLELDSQAQPSSTTMPPDQANTQPPDCVERVLPEASPERIALRFAYETVHFQEQLGCPIAYIEGLPAATQRMERGEFLWVDLGRPIDSVLPLAMSGRFIYALFSPGPSYQRYPDTWISEQDPYIYHIRSPGPGLYAPAGGFGKLWVNDSNVRDRLGWAIESPSKEWTADVVVFDNIYNDPGNLGMMVLLRDINVVYAFGRLDKPEEVQVIFT